MSAEASLGALRAEVRSFLADEIVSGSFLPNVDSWLSGWDPSFSRKVAAKGWIGMTWPQRYGGHGRTQAERHVVIEELLAAGAPVAAHWIADRQAGASLLTYGTEEQRLKFLPAIASGECFFAIGMSEPDAGSDLASVRTRAVPVDGGWSVTGTKLWTGGAQAAHAFFVLCRTTAPPADGDRHAGLAQLIVMLDAPGVVVRPIQLMSGEAHFNEVVLDEVFVPHSMVLGSVGDGWLQVTSELVYERSGPERFLSTYPLLKELVATLAAKRDVDGLVDPDASRVTGRAISELWALRMLSWSQVSGELTDDNARAVRAAMTKDLGTGFEQRVVDLYRELAPAEDASPSRVRDLYERALVQAPGFTLRGGTTEVLRTVVARSLTPR